MKYEIFYPTDLSKIQDIYNDNIDVCVNDECGNAYTFIVATPDNLKWIMSNCGESFLDPVYPILTVECLSKENVEAAVNAVMNASNEVIGFYGSDDFMRDMSN